jgi:hypothetical protein
MIGYAAQQGHDKVAFVRGAQAVERFSLERQVQENHVGLRADGRYSVDATEEFGGEQRITDRAGIDGTGLASLILTELAEKAIVEAERDRRGASTWACCRRRPSAAWSTARCRSEAPPSA